MDATVCIPWRPTPERVPIFDRVTDWWERQGFSIVTGDSDFEHFNLSAARNAAVDNARTEHVIVADADTIPTLDSVLEALHCGGIVYPFEYYRYLGDHNPHVDDVATSPFEREIPGSTGGILVTTKTIYWQVGGMDEQFTRWGYEDRAFNLAAMTLASSGRLKGYVYAYGHDADRDMTDNNPGKQRMELYRQACYQPAAMMELTGCSQRSSATPAASSRSNG